MNIYQAANNIAKRLGHGCALTLLEMLEISSLKEWNDAMRNKGIAHNDETNDSPGSIEGWTETHYGRQKPRYSHTTQSGRLDIIVSDDLGGTLELRINTPAGQVARVIYIIREHPYFGNDVMFDGCDFNIDLITGREDRLHLLWMIDDMFDGAFEHWMKNNRVYPELVAARETWMDKCVMEMPNVWVHRSGHDSIQCATRKRDNKIEVYYDIDKSGTDWWRIGNSFDDIGDESQEDNFADCDIETALLSGMYISIDVEGFTTFHRI